MTNGLGWQHAEPSAKAADVCRYKVVDQGFQKVARKSRDFCFSMLKGTGVNFLNVAKFVLNPPPELEKLYGRAFGSDWRRHAVYSTHLERDSINVLELLLACTTAAAYELAWNDELPWEGPEDIMAKLSKYHAYIDLELSWHKGNSASAVVCPRVI